MKKAILCALVIVAILIAAPFVNGLMMEKMLRHQVDRLNEMYATTPYSLNFEITRYDRGFSSSEIEFVLSIPELQNIDDFKTLVLTQQAKHGISGVTSTTSLGQNRWYTDFINETLGGRDPLSITSHFNIFSGLTNTVTLKAFDLDLDEEHLSISPGELVIKTDQAFKHILANGHFEGLAIPGAVDIRGISLASDLHLISNIIMDGESSLSIEHVSLHDSRRKKVFAVISSITGSSILDYDEDRQKLSTHVKYSIGKIASDTEEVNDISLCLGINQLDSVGLENFYAAYTDMVSETLARISPAANNPKQAEEMLAQQLPLMGLALLAEVEQLLKKDLQIEISDLHMALPQGEVEGNLAIGLKKDMTLASFATLAQQPEKLVEVFSFASNLTLPEGLIPNQENLLVPMLPGMQSGLFEQLGETLVHKAEIRDNMLLLNGKELVLRQ